MIEEFLKKKGFNQSRDELLNPVSLSSSPFDYENMNRAIGFLKEKKELGEKGYIVGHDDMDGISATIIGTQLLKKMGIPHNVHIPLREYEPHGLSFDLINKSLDDGSNFIFSVDCGLSDTKEIKYGQELGLDFLILDHHILNITETTSFLYLHPEKGKGFPHLSASALTMNLFLGFLYTEGYILDEIIDKFPDLFIIAAGGILADRVALLGDNLMFVRYAQQILSNGKGNLTDIYKNVFSGTPSLWNFVSLFSGLSSREAISLVFELFGEEEKALKREYLKRIVEEGKISARLGRESLQFAKESLLVGKHCITAVDPRIRLRNLGWIANILKRKYHLPAVVISKRKKDDIWVGEGRSNLPYSIYRALSNLQDLFLDFGGHTHAAGFSISEDNIDALIKRLEKILQEKSRDSIETPDVVIEGDNVQELSLLLELGKRHLDFSCLIKRVDPNNFNGELKGHITEFPDEPGLYDLLLSVDTSGARVFWKSKHIE